MIFKYESNSSNNEFKVGKFGDAETRNGVPE